MEVGNNFKPILHLRKSKADQESIGRVTPISRELGNLIIAWREKIGAHSGFILRAISKYGTVSPKLSPGLIQLILKSVGNSINTSVEGNSFRVGAALDLLKKGETLERIMIKGNLKSQDSAMQYL